MYVSAYNDFVLGEAIHPFEVDISCGRVKAKASRFVITFLQKKLKRKYFHVMVVIILAFGFSFLYVPMKVIAIGME